MDFAIAHTAAPLLNSPDFKKIFGHHLPLDNQGLLRETEMIALPTTKFQILSLHGDYIYQAKTLDYPSDIVYVDGRFLTSAHKNTPERAKILPSSSQILENLISLKGAPYVWGGNWSSGIPQMLELYPPSKPLDSFTHTHWIFKGVDCSGLLYQATNGCLPRNTSEMVSFGRGVPIENLTVKTLISQLKPLDLIVWKGHVVVVFDHHSTIESRHGSGVVLCSIQERLLEILEQRAPVNNWEESGAPAARFVIRRWHPEYVSF